MVWSNVFLISLVIAAVTLDVVNTMEGMEESHQTHGPTQHTGLHHDEDNTIGGMEETHQTPGQTQHTGTQHVKRIHSRGLILVHFPANHLNPSNELNVAICKNLTSPQSCTTICRSSGSSHANWKGIYIVPFLDVPTLDQHNTFYVADVSGQQLAIEVAHLEIADEDNCSQNAVLEVNGVVFQGGQNYIEIAQDTEKVIKIKHFKRSCEGYTVKLKLFQFLEHKAHNCKLAGELWEQERTVRDFFEKRTFTPVDHELKFDQIHETFTLPPMSSGLLDLIDIRVEFTTGKTSFILHSSVKITYALNEDAIFIQQRFPEVDQYTWTVGETLYVDFSDTRDLNVRSKDMVSRNDDAKKDEALAVVYDVSLVDRRHAYCLHKYYFSDPENLRDHILFRKSGRMRLKPAMLVYNIESDDRCPHWTKIDLKYRTVIADADAVLASSGELEEGQQPIKGELSTIVHYTYVDAPRVDIRCVFNCLPHADTKPIVYKAVLLFTKSLFKYLLKWTVTWGGNVNCVTCSKEYHTQYITVQPPNVLHYHLDKDASYTGTSLMISIDVSPLDRTTANTTSSLTEFLYYKHFAYTVDSTKRHIDCSVVERVYWSCTIPDDILTITGSIERSYMPLIYALYVLTDKDTKMKLLHSTTRETQPFSGKFTVPFEPGDETVQMYPMVFTKSGGNPYQVKGYHFETDPTRTLIARRNRTNNTDFNIREIASALLNHSSIIPWDKNLYSKLSVLRMIHQQVHDNHIIDPDFDYELTLAAMNSLTVTVYEQLDSEFEAAHALSQQITMTADILFDHDFNVEQAEMIEIIISKLTALVEDRLLLSDLVVNSFRQRVEAFMSILDFYLKNAVYLANSRLKKECTFSISQKSCQNHLFAHKKRVYGQNYARKVAETSTFNSFWPVPDVYFTDHEGNPFFWFECHLGKLEVYSYPDSDMYSLIIINGGMCDSMVHFSSKDGPDHGLSFLIDIEHWTFSNGETLFRGNERGLSNFVYMSGGTKCLSYIDKSCKNSPIKVPMGLFFSSFRKILRDNPQTVPFKHNRHTDTSAIDSSCLLLEIDENDILLPGARIYLRLVAPQGVTWTYQTMSLPDDYKDRDIANLDLQRIYNSTKIPFEVEKNIRRLVLITVVSEVDFNTSGFGVTIELEYPRCSMYNPIQRTWVDMPGRPEYINDEFIECHFTTQGIPADQYKPQNIVYSPFASGMADAWKLLDTKDHAFLAYAQPYAMAFALIGLTLLTMLAVMVLHRKDENDSALNDTYVLRNNYHWDAPDQFLVKIKTGSRRDSDSSNTVYISLIGSRGASEEILLHAPCFHEKNSELWFVVGTSKVLGMINAVEVGLIMRDYKDVWYCEKINVYSMRTSVVHRFKANIWLGRKRVNAVIYNQTSHANVEKFKKWFVTEICEPHTILSYCSGIRGKKECSLVKNTIRMYCVIIMSLLVGYLMNAHIDSQEFLHAVFTMMFSVVLRFLLFTIMWTTRNTVVWPYNPTMDRPQEAEEHLLFNYCADDHKEFVSPAFQTIYGAPRKINFDTNVNQNEPDGLTLDSEQAAFLQSSGHNKKRSQSLTKAKERRPKRILRFIANKTKAGLLLMLQGLHRKHPSDSKYLTNMGIGDQNISRIVDHGSWSQGLLGRLQQFDINRKQKKRIALASALIFLLVSVMLVGTGFVTLYYLESSYHALLLLKTAIALLISYALEFGFYILLGVFEYFTFYRKKLTPHSKIEYLLRLNELIEVVKNKVPRYDKPSVHMYPMCRVMAGRTSFMVEKGSALHKYLCSNTVRRSNTEKSTVLIAKGGYTVLILTAICMLLVSLRHDIQNDHRQTQDLLNIMGLEDDYDNPKFMTVTALYETIMNGVISLDNKTIPFGKNNDVEEQDEAFKDTIYILLGPVQVIQEHTHFQKCSDDGMALVGNETKCLSARMNTDKFMGSWQAKYDELTRLDSGDYQRCYDHSLASQGYRKSEHIIHEAKSVTIKKKKQLSNSVCKYGFSFGVSASSENNTIFVSNGCRVIATVCYIISNAHFSHTISRRFWETAVENHISAEITGYQVHLELHNEQYRTIIDNWKRANWIDQGTARIIIIFVVYNPESNLMSICKIEYTRHTGSFKVKYTFETFRDMVGFSETKNYGVFMVSLGLFVIIWLWSWAEICLWVRDDELIEHFRTVNAWIQLVSPIPALYFVYIWYLEETLKWDWREKGSEYLKASNNDKLFEDIHRDLHTAVLIERLLIGLMCVYLIFKSLGKLREIQRLQAMFLLVPRTLQLTLQPLIITCALSWYAIILYGKKLGQYRDVVNSFTMTWQSVNQPIIEPEITNTIKEDNYWLAYIFFSVEFWFMQQVIISFFIVFIDEAYGSIHRECLRKEGLDLKKWLFYLLGMEKFLEGNRHPEDPYTNEMQELTNNFMESRKNGFFNQ